MNLAELLASPAASLPKRAYQEPFIDALALAIDSYLAGVSALTANDAATSEARAAAGRMRSVSDSLIEAVRAALKGQPARAREHLDRALKPIVNEITALTSIDLDGKALKTLYRLRVEAPGARLSRAEMFHIPAEKRHLVAPQRFSVIGVPMLYLGSTVYVCWEELGRPELNRVWLSAFKLKPQRTLRVLNLAYRPSWVSQLLKSINSPTAPSDVTRLAAAYAIAWPLIAACMFPVRERQGAFKVEYVIPQLLMSWITERDEFLGVRYFSTHVGESTSNMAAVNFVLPATNLSATGPCSRLVDLFEFTEPVSWTYSEAAGTQTSYLYHGRVDATLDVGGGYPVRYEGSKFARIEFNLDQLPFTGL